MTQVNESVAVGTQNNDSEILDELDELLSGRLVDGDGELMELQDILYDQLLVILCTVQRAEEILNRQGEGFEHDIMFKIETWKGMVRKLSSDVLGVE